MGLTFVLGNELEKCFWSRHEQGHRKIYEPLLRNGTSDLFALALSHQLTITSFEGFTSRYAIRIRKFI